MAATHFREYHCHSAWSNLAQMSSLDMTVIQEMLREETSQASQ